MRLRRDASGKWSGAAVIIPKGIEQLKIEDKVPNDPVLQRECGGSPAPLTVMQKPAGPDVRFLP